MKPKLTSLFLISLPMVLFIGLISGKASLLGRVSYGIHSVLGPIGILAYLAAFALQAKAVYSGRSYGNRMFLAPAFVLALGFLHLISLGGVGGEALWSMAYAMLGSKPAAYLSMALLTALAVAVDRIIYKAEQDEATILSMAQAACKAYDEEKRKPKIHVPTHYNPEHCYGSFEEIKPRVIRERYIEDPKPKKTKKIKNYPLPTLEILRPCKNQVQTADEVRLQAAGNKLIKALAQFKVEAGLKDFVVGPTVTTFRLVAGIGTKFNRVLNLHRELMAALETPSIRIIAPIAGTNMIGIEVPNETRLTVGFRGALEEIPETAAPTTVVIGQRNDGQYVHCNLAKMPHLLVAGTTGSGKSVCLQGMIASLLMRNTPDRLQLALIDPKRTEFGLFSHLPHLWKPVVYNEPAKAEKLLEALVEEMEERYQTLELAGCKNIEVYNKKRKQKMPYIVLFVEEFADLMMLSKGKKRGKSPFETLICRIAQKARACGIHAVIATQRPSADVVSGLIKSNFPSAIACKVRSLTDSRVILDEGGAEALIGNGDLLYKPVTADEPKRVQGAFVSETDLAAIVAHYQRG